MAGVSRQETVEMSATKDQRPVKDLISNGPYPALGERVGLRRTDGGGDDTDPFGFEDGIEGAGELRVSIRMRKRTPVGSTSSMKRLRACWVTKEASGLRVDIVT
jgi:hypothetical protein